MGRERTRQRGREKERQTETEREALEHRVQVSEGVALDKGRIPPLWK